MKVLRLALKKLQLDGSRSIAKDVHAHDCRGIYAYRFTDGSWYVGKSVDVRKRHQEHLHEYRHLKPALVMESMYFAPVRSNDPRVLDKAETHAISWFTKKGYRIRNISKTEQPGGTDPIFIEFDGKFGIEIPWERGKRPKGTGMGKLVVDGAMSAAKMHKFRDLAALPLYGELRRLTCHYIFETIPAPSDTVCRLWIATAMPDRGSGGPISCISCGNLEVLTCFLSEDEHDVFGYLNMKDPRDGSKPWRCRGLRRWNFRSIKYRAANHVVSASFRSLSGLEQLLSSEVVLNWCYRLNAELMRRGSCMYTRFANGYFIEDLLFS